MRSFTAHILLAFVAQAHVQDSADQLADKLIEKLVSKLSDRVSLLQHADLDETALGKPSHLSAPSTGVSTNAMRAMTPSLGGRSPPMPNSQAPSATCKARQMQFQQCKSRARRQHQHRRVTANAATATEEKTGGSTALRSDLRNIAIVAHVDHGKTTLVDAMLQSAGALDKGDGRETVIGDNERVMDSNDQERERGITILAKNTALNYGDTRINIVDTPGHADFGGEVERVLNMVDAVLLLVDAYEGPKPQTRFVLKKAIKSGVKILVVINKVDKPSARTEYVVDKTFDLFCELGASDEQTDFPIIYASAINRIAGESEDPKEMKDMEPLFKKILELPKPPGDVDSSLQLQISNIGSDPFIGRLGIGRIKSGVIRSNEQIGLSAGPGAPVETVKVAELFNFDALGRAKVQEAKAGDIVMFSGVKDFNIGDTLVDPEDPRPLDPITVEQPTMTTTFSVNKSPFAGKVGKLLTGRQIRDRLDKEKETNVALRVEDTDNPDTMSVSGRGLLHLTVLMENMRREGFEMQVGCPEVIEKTIDGQRMEPFELVDIEIPDDCSGAAINLLNERKGCMINMGPAGEGLTEIQYEVPARGMNGVKSKLLTASKGLVVMTTTFGGYKPYAGDFPRRRTANMLSMATGMATTYSLANAQQRGSLFIPPGEEVYENQIIGISAREQPISMNVCKTKALTNMRAAGADEKTKMEPPKDMSLEECVEYIQDGEFVEITPEAIRMGQFPKPAKPR
jgi:GTP-binding protein